MRENKILARAKRIQKENWGETTEFFRGADIYVRWDKRSYERKQISCNSSQLQTHRNFVHDSLGLILDLLYL